MDAFGPPPNDGLLQERIVIFGINATLSDGKYNKDNSSVESFGISLGINAGIMIVLVTIFLVLRTFKIKWLPVMFNFRRYFNARTKGVKFANKRVPYLRVPEQEPFDKRALGNRRFPAGLFSWLWPIFGGYRLKKIFHSHGADAAMYLVFLRNCVFFAIAITGPALVILLPINATGTNKDLAQDDPNYVTGMGIITIGNVDPDKDGRLAAHVVFTYIFSILAYIMAFATYWEYTRIRRKYFKKNCARAFTVMVEEVPKRWKSDKGLKKFFQSVCNIKVTASHLAYQTDKARKTHDKRQEYIFKYEENLRLHEKKTICWNCCPWCDCCPGGTYGPTDPTTTTGCFGCCRGVPKIGDKVDALPFYRGKVRKHEAKLRGMQENPASKLKKTHVGFVSFESAFMARVACYPEMSSPVRVKYPNCCLLAMKVTPAPEPENIIWENLNVYQGSFILRSLLITLIMIVLILFWFVPTILITSIANIQYLSGISGFSWLDGINDLPAGFRGLVQGFLPTLALFILFQLVYPLLKLVVLKLGGFHVKSTAYWLIFFIYWGFLVINVLFVVTIGGSVIGFIEQVVDSPADIVELLAATLPQQSLFFIQYLMIAGLGRQVISLLRVLNMIKWFFGLLFASNKKQRNWARIPGDFEYPRAAAQDMLIFYILIVYSVMAPLITPFGIMYFGLSYLTTKYNMLYAYVPQWESGGQIWPLLFHPFMGAILLFQLTMLGLLAVNVSGAAIPLIILPFITGLVWIFVDRAWKLPARYGPIKECGEMKWKEEYARAYIDPSLRSDLWSPYNEAGQGDGDEDDDDDEERGAYEPPPISPRKKKEQEGEEDDDDEEGHESSWSTDVHDEERGEGEEDEVKETDDTLTPHSSRSLLPSHTHSLEEDDSDVELDILSGDSQKKNKKKKQKKNKKTPSMISGGNLMKRMKKDKEKNGGVENV